MCVLVWMWMCWYRLTYRHTDKHPCTYRCVWMWMCWYNTKAWPSWVSNVLAVTALTQFHQTSHTPDTNPANNMCVSVFVCREVIL